MARPRKPTKLLEISGAFKHNPNRRRPNEPKETRELGEPPERLPASVIPFWQELVDQAASGVLTCADRWTVELAARLMEKAVVRDCISSAELATLNRLLASMGMTPADRSKLSVQAEKPKNPFAELAK